MSFSKKNIGFYVKISVFITRFIAWLSGSNAKKAKNRSDEFKGKILTNYFAKKYLPCVENFPQKEITIETPETIWQFWDNQAGKTTPEIVKTCLESVNKFKEDFEHKILTKSTMENYSDLPGYVLDKFKKGQIDYTHFSDLLRLNLLKNHGGIWLDATGYMTDFVPKFILDEDFFVFLTGRLTHFPYSFMQSCFIRAKKGSFLCDAWYEMSVEYWKKENKKLEYFQIHLMFKALVEQNPIAKNLFAKMPHTSEDGIQQLVGNKLLQKFDAEEWRKIKKMSFFQKTTYKVANRMNYSDTYFSKLSTGEI
jgi:hypothetical protein